MEIRNKSSHKWNRRKESKYKGKKSDTVDLTSRKMHKKSTKTENGKKCRISWKIKQKLRRNVEKIEIIVVYNRK